MARGGALAALLAAVALLATAGAGGAATDQTPKRGGTLVFAQPQPEPGCLDPLLEKCAPDTARIQLDAITSLVLQAPFEIGPDFTWRPALVSGAEFTTRPPFTLTYHIRPDAKWNDGVPVTARDFVFTHAAILRNSDVADGYLKSLHASVRVVRAVDAKTVEVVLRSRLADWHNLFGPVLPAHALGRSNLAAIWRDRIDDPRTGRPIGDGPFLVERWDRGRQLVLARNARFSGQHPPYVDRLVVRFGLQTPDVAEALRRGEVDVAYNFPPSVVPDVRRDRALRVSSAPSTGWEHLDFRIGPGGNPLLRNKLVRRAIAFGIDRAAITRRLTDASGLRYQVLDNTSFLSQSRYYRRNWSEYRYRPGEARRLLERAGCRLGADGIYACAGIRLSLRFFTHVSSGSIRPGILAQVQSQLRRAGVDAVPTFAPPSAIFGPDGVYGRGDFDVGLFAWLRQSPDPGNKVIFGCGQSENYTGYCQRLVTADLQEAERLLGADRQAAVLNRADARIANDVPILPLFQHPIWAGLAGQVRGYVPYGNSGLTGAENWWLDR